MNSIASIVILPMMVLAIVVFSRFTGGGQSRTGPPESGILVVANLRAESLAFLDVASGELRELVLPGPPHEMVEADGRLYVTLGRGNALVEVEASSAAILRVVPLEGEPHGLALYGANLIVTLDKANAAVVLDRASLTELKRYATGDTPHAVAVSEDAVLVTDSRDNSIRQLESAERTVPAGGQPEGIAIAGGRVITADATTGTVTIASSRDLSEVKTVDVGALPVRVIAYDATRALVALQGEGQVALVDLRDGHVERRMKTASRPDGLCLAPGGDYLAAVSNAEGTVDVFSTEDWKPVASFAFVQGAGSCIWLTSR